MNTPAIANEERAALSLCDELGEVEYERLIAIWFKKWGMPATTPLKRDNRTPAQRAYVREMARHEMAGFANEAVIA